MYELSELLVKAGANPYIKDVVSKFVAKCGNAFLLGLINFSTNTISLQPTVRKILPGFGYKCCCSVLCITFKQARLIVSLNFGSSIVHERLYVIPVRHTQGPPFPIFITTYSRITTKTTRRQRILSPIQIIRLLFNQRPFP